MRTRASGAFTTRYRFRSSAPRKTYPMRVRVRPDAAYPYAVGYSRACGSACDERAARPAAGGCAGRAGRRAAGAGGRGRAGGARGAAGGAARRGRRTTSTSGARARAWVADVTRPSLRRVHQCDRRDRAHEPRAGAAGRRRRVDAVARAARGYSNLELDLATGARGSRHAHVEGLLRALTGAEAGMVVNNGAGAALLAAAALAGPGREVVVSRGQLVEIGGGFRVPDVIAQAGARLVEVGTTNRTRLADYERGVRRADTGAVLRVHQSNFRQLGFVEDVPDRGAVRARRAGDRRRRLGGAAGRGGRADRAALGARRRGARVLLRRQAARRAAGGAARRPRGGGRGGEAASAGAGAADRQALAGRARGDAAPASRRAGGDPGAGHAARDARGARGARRRGSRPRSAAR